MPDLLEFNPNRELHFTTDRPRSFDSNRGLQFDHNRDLGFNPGRDIGFGKHGPVFRGYVCPVCAAPVTETQPSCTSCGAIFDPKPASQPVPSPPPQPPSATTSVPAPPTPSARPPPPPARVYPPPPKRIEFQHCMYCGARVSVTDGFCWNCGNAMYAGPGR